MTSIPGEEDLALVKLDLVIQESGVIHVGNIYQGTGSDLSLGCADFSFVRIAFRVRVVHTPGPLSDFFREVNCSGFRA